MVMLLPNPEKTRGKIFFFPALVKFCPEVILFKNYREEGLSKVRLKFSQLKGAQA
jgi:hypothetical protein